MQSFRALVVESLESRRLPSGGAVPVPFDGGLLYEAPPPASARSALDAGSPQVLFVDFNGATITTDPVGFGYQMPYQVPKFSLASLGFGGQEATAENYILQFVQEDYAAYNLIVTTTQPTSGPYSTIYMAGQSFAGPGVLGEAPYDIGNLNHSDFGFVFTQEFGAYASGNSLFTLSEYLANTVSHEAGHLFGLNHVTGSPSIMEPVLNFTPAQLSFGSGSNEDSQAMLAANLGYHNGVADDFGNTAATATPLALNSAINGILERHDDADAFTITSDVTQSVTLDITTTPFGNLDSVLTVKDVNGTTIAFNDNFNGSEDSHLVFTAAAGQPYTIFVTSAGGASSGTYTLHAITANGGAPAISLTEEVGTADDLALPFGAQVVGSTTQHTFTVTNTGQSTLDIAGLQVLGDNAFSLDATSQPNNSSDDILIAAGQSHTFTVSYTPTAPGTDAATVQILSNDPLHPTTTLGLSGLAGYPHATITEADGVNDGQLALGSVRAAFHSTLPVATISNNGDAPLHVTLGLGSGTALGFSNSSPSEITIAPGATETIDLDARPLTPTSFGDTLTIATDDPTLASTQVQVSGQAYMQVEPRHPFTFLYNGARVAVSLQGAGAAQVFLNDAGTAIQELDLIGTNDTTRFKIAGSVTLGSVQGDGGLKSFLAPTADLLNGTFDLIGPVGRLSLQDVVNSDLHATQIDQLNVHTLDQAQVLADEGLVSARVLGDMIDSSIDVFGHGAGSSSGVGKVKVTGDYVGSTISAGVNVTELAATLAASSAPSSGSGIGSVILGHVQTDNAGTQFGIFSSGSISSIRVGTNHLTVPYLSDDFVVAVLS